MKKPNWQLKDQIFLDRPIIGYKMSRLDFKLGYNYLSIESFRFNMQADFYKFQLDSNLTKKILLDLKNKNLNNDDWNTYNIFSFDDNSIKNLKNSLLENLFVFLNDADINIPKKIYALGWLNILKPKDTIAEHFHSLEKNNFFSCNVSLDNYNSVTTFHLPWADRYGDIIEIENLKGSSFIFPSWLWHGVYNVDKERYSLGIDFYTQERISDYFEKEHDKNPAPIQYATLIYDVDSY